MPIEAPGLPLSHQLKRLLIFVLVGFQKGDDLSAFERELRQEFCCHPFAIYHHPLHQQRQVYRLLIAAQHLWQTNRQVVIASMRCGQEWMSLSIV